MPIVWIIDAYRAGERAQVRALVQALGWPYQTKQLSYRKTEFRTSLFRGSDLRGIRLDRSSPLKPPWPDLVISAGMRNEPVGRWIITHLASPAAFDRVAAWYGDDAFFYITLAAFTPIPYKVATIAAGATVIAADNGSRQRERPVPGSMPTSTDGSSATISVRSNWPVLAALMRK